MGYPTDDEFRASMENRAPPRPRSLAPSSADVVTNDRRVHQLTEKLYGVDFGVNMDGHSRARIAQVIVAVVVADRSAIVDDIRRVAFSMPAQPVCADDETCQVTAIKVETLKSAIEGIENRYPLPDVSTKTLWAAAQSNKVS